VMSTLAALLFREQAAINDWKRRTGRPVDPASEQIEAAFADCVKYARNLSHDVKEIATQS